jgi:SAM-dependent methyltransferase
LFLNKVLNVDFKEIGIMKTIYRLLTIFGLDPLRTFYSIKSIPFFIKNFIILNQQKKLANVKFAFGSFYPCLADRFSDSGVANGHYFHQDLLVAKKIYQNNPKKHVDIGSRIDGFVAHLAVFREVEVFDIRSLDNTVKNINFKKMDLMTGDSTLFEYCDSISSLHAVEHFGMGRYGDPVNYDGYLIGLNNLYEILRKNGKFYFSVPIGPQRIEFDAHRIFSMAYLLDLFKVKYSIDSFSYVDDRGDLYEDVEITEKNEDDNFGCSYGCGIFEMTKL